ncbi:MAG: tRNA pseudouridine(55) synthase TruB [Geobacteraceae bacterium]|nr:tRNA pseudouridine(55) synthase TruB [Geobacteraceae bacterium]
MDGFFVIDKPVGLTSHDVVSFVRRILRTKKAGHTGTLDPFATGVLPVAVGRGTKAIPFLDDSVKEYRATMRLGVATDTQDCTGNALFDKEYRHVSRELLLEVFIKFTGKIRQIPPMFSAVKIGGVPLYKHARKGNEINRPARDIEILSLSLANLELPFVTFAVSCSRGTYVRTLANDIGETLGCGAHLTQLRRTRSGRFSEEEAMSLDEFVEKADKTSLESVLISPYSALSDLKDLQLDETSEIKVFHGVVPEECNIIELSGQELLQSEKFRLSRGTRLLAVAERTGCQMPGSSQNTRLLRVFT